MMNFHSVAEFEGPAKQRADDDLWDLISNGAGDGTTLLRNRKAFDGITINPRFLVDVSCRDTSTTVLGETISFPVMTAPAAPFRHAHPEGELAVARAAGRTETIMAVPTLGSSSIEEIAEIESNPLWFQLYHLSDEISELLVTRAADAGYKAICLTVDIQDMDIRDNHSVRRGFYLEDELRIGHLRDHQQLLDRSSLRISIPPWKRLGWLRSLTGLPLVLKGVRTVDDALIAADHGIDGIIVSNHGGRYLDGVPASIEVLPDIADAVGGDIEVYLDSGIRRGTDVLKALTMGARAVMIGRPVFWGLAVGGEEGVYRVLEILREEFDHAMAFCGITNVEGLDRRVLSWK